MLDTEMLIGSKFVIGTEAHRAKLIEIKDFIAGASAFRDVEYRST